MEERKKVLVVDDERDFLDVIRLRLEVNGYEVLTATGGREALEKVRLERPDAVLLDIQMPKMDGIKVLKELRKIDENLPVFMLTGSTDQKRFEQANRLKASGFIIKTSDLQREIDNITSAIRVASRYRHS